MPTTRPSKIVRASCGSEIADTLARRTMNLLSRTLAGSIPFSLPKEVEWLSVTLRQTLRVAGYLAKQKLRGVEKFPLLVEVEPLFQCNLACSFCRKIQYPELPRAALTNVMLFRRESNKYQVV
jgi:hypothetical protein